MVECILLANDVYPPNEFIIIAHSNYLLTITYMSKSVGYVVPQVGFEPTNAAF